MSPRWRRALIMLQQGSVTAMSIGIGAGISNVSALIFDLRRKGLTIPCQMVEVLNRDGDTCRVGKFSLSDADKKIVRQWLGA